MIGELRLLLADEPTGNLDQETGAQAIDLMFGLARDRGSSRADDHPRSLARGQRAGRQLRANEGT